MYYFKNKDNVLAILEKTIYGFHIECVYCNLVPVLNMLVSDDAINNWINLRGTPLARAFADAIYRTGGVKTSHDFVDVSMCLSLKDTFWITKDNSIKWSDVSLFRCSFSKVYTDIASGLSGYNGQVIKTPTPEFTVNGCSMKYFKRINGDINFYKTYSGLAELEFVGAYSEYLACQLYEALGLSHFVNYSLVKNTNDIVLSKSSLITNENIGMVDIYYLANDAEHLESHITHYKGLALQHFKEMMITDCLLLNIDRHDENIAMLFDTNTYTILDIVPIYDLDHSLLYNINLSYRSFDSIKEHILSLYPKTYYGHTFQDQFNFCMTSDMLKKLYLLKDFEFKNHDKFPMNSKRLEVLNKVFKWNLSKLIKGYLDARVR